MRDVTNAEFISAPAPNCRTHKHMHFNIHGGLSLMTSESLMFNGNNEGRSQTITMLMELIRMHVT